VIEIGEIEADLAGACRADLDQPATDRKARQGLPEHHATHRIEYHIRAASLRGLAHRRSRVRRPDD